MAAKSQEIWETTTGGTTYVNVRDPRNPDGWTRKKVGGKGSKRITLTVEEREFNQELVQYENEHQDPFRNGLLVRVSPGVIEDRGENERTDEELIAILKTEDDIDFQATIEAINSEVLLRRLLGLANKHASMLRFEAIQHVVDDRYRIGKTSRVVRELMADDDRYAEADL